MSRRKASAKRSILPDPLYKSELLAKFINVLMCNGKKAVAEKIVYCALDKVFEKKGKKNENKQEEILSLFNKVLDLVRPLVEVRSCRVGGATYQVPVEVAPERGVALAMRWLVKAAQSRSEQGMILRLTGEMLDVFENRGNSLKKREDVHRMAKANQAFAHYRW